MSEMRIPNMSFCKVLPLYRAKQKRVLFQLYEAGQFKRRLDGRHFSREFPVRKSQREEFYRNMFRLRIDGKWYGKRKYTFFTKREIANLLLEM